MPATIASVSGRGHASLLGGILVRSCGAKPERCAVSASVCAQQRLLSSTSRATSSSPSDSVRPLLSGLPYRSKFNKYKPPDIAVDHLVIGGGVVGLAIAYSLAKRWPNKTTYLVERHTSVGNETSSRNSEVVHAGLYYPSESYKTKMCLRGRELMYKLCEKESIPIKQTGKLVVGGDGSLDYFKKLKQHCESLPKSYSPFMGQNDAGFIPLQPPPVRLLTGDEARELEPSLSPSISHALLSERTGIVDSHELMAFLHRQLDEECESAEVVLDTSVVRVDPVRKEANGAAGAGSGKRGEDKSGDGFVVQTVTGDLNTAEPGDADSILARVLINASGLNGPLVLNSLIMEGQGLANGKENLIPMWYSKGNYVSYKGKDLASINHLIYPTPFMGSEKDGKSEGAHSHQSLGTHLTLDLAGQIKFGPDTEWLSAPSSAEEAVDFWTANLSPPQDDDPRLDQMHGDITSYLPSISREGLSPDYAGIRPKLVGPGGGFMDFTFLYHSSLKSLASQALWQKDIPKEAQGGGLMISLLGIESPGLTSSLAIGEMLQEKIAKEVWGDHNSSRVKHVQNEELGGKELDGWA